MTNKTKHIFLSLIALLFFCTKAKSETLDNYWEGIPNEVQKRYESANINITEKWVLTFADSLDLMAKELKVKRLNLFASQLRSHYSYAKNDSAEFMKHCQKTQELALENDLSPFYFTEKISIVLFHLNNHHRHLAFRAVQDIMKDAKDMNDIGGIYSGYFTMSYVYNEKRDYKHSIENAVKAIKCLEDMDTPSLATKATLYNILATNYLMDKQYDKCIENAQIALSYDNGQPEILYSLCRAHFEKGDIEKFRLYANLFLQSKSKDPYIFDAWVDVVKSLMFLSNKQYEIALATTKKIKDKPTALECQLLIYKASGEWEKAYTTKNKLVAYDDSLSNAIFTEEISEMSGELDTLYKVKDKDEELIKQRSYLIIGAVIILAIVMCSIFVILRYKTIKRKNQALASNIDKLIKYKQQVLELENEKYGKTIHPNTNDELMPRNTESINEDKESIVNETENKQYVVNPQEENDDSNVEATNDDENLACIARFIYELTSRKLFTDVNFSRESLLDELHIQRRTFTKKFEAYTGSTFKEYITGLRLEYAAQLIKEHPEYTIEAIAVECGIASYVTFHRNFTRHFGIAPSQYRTQG